MLPAVRPVWSLQGRRAGNIGAAHVEAGVERVFAGARICREAGARVATSVALRELNLDVPATDGRRIEVVANGLPLWRGGQIAVDTTLVSPIQRDGSARPGADVRPALALQQARARKLRTYPELPPGGQGLFFFFLSRLFATAEDGQRVDPTRGAHPGAA